MEDKIKFENDSMAIELVKILSLPSNASWAEIFIEIGRLQGKRTPQEDTISGSQYPKPFYADSVRDITHYHDGIMCTKSPCVWS